jgi:hypothetical protein
MAAKCDLHDTIEKTIDDMKKKVDKTWDGVTEMRATMHVWFFVIAIMIPSTTWLLMNGLAPIIRKAEASCGQIGSNREYAVYNKESMEYTPSRPGTEGANVSRNDKDSKPHDLDYVGGLK